jgi:hypothetical protein
LRNLIEAMEPIPVILQSPRQDVLASNRAARILLTDFDALPLRDRNIPRWLFLDPRTRIRYPDWEEVAAPTVAALRASRNPQVRDDALEALVGELSVASPEFARYWTDYRLFKHASGTKRIFHEAVGVMTLNYQTLEVSGTDGQFLSTYTADVGSPSDEKLRLLMSWNAVPDAAESPSAAEDSR